MPRATTSDPGRTDATPGPWRNDSAAGEIRTAGPRPRTLAALVALVAGGADRALAEEPPAKGQLMAAAP